jgi:hypothetical protein
MDGEWDDVCAAGWYNPTIPKENIIGNKATTPIAKKDLENVIGGSFSRGQQ